MANSKPTPDERFDAKWIQQGECWVWQANKDKRGYGRFNLDGYHIGAAHRYAWERAFGPIPSGIFVCHRCDNPACVNPEHLFLGTHQDNMIDMVGKQRHQTGEKKTLAKLTEARVIEIRRRYAAGGITMRELADEYGFGLTTIYKVVTGKTWAHLPIDGKPERYANLRGEKHPSAKLTAEQVREIRARYAAGGITQIELARQYSVTKGCIRHVLIRMTWPHI